MKIIGSHRKDTNSINMDNWWCEIKMAMNGLRSASRDFFDFFSGVLTKKCGFIQSNFVCDWSTFRILICVDDPLAIWKAINVTSTFAKLRKWMPLTYIGRRLQYVQAIGQRWIMIRLPKEYIRAFLEVLDLQRCNGTEFPGCTYEAKPGKARHDNPLNPKDHGLFLRHWESYIFGRKYRPEVKFAIIQVAMLMANPLQSFLVALNIILKCLKQYDDQWLYLTIWRQAVWHEGWRLEGHHNPRRFRLGKRHKHQT